MLPSAVQHIVSRVEDENIQKTVKRIIQIWSERQVYQPDAIKLLKTSYENGVRFYCSRDFRFHDDLLGSKERFRW